LELPRLVKKAMENKCWKGREMEHTHLERWTSASGKWVIPRHGCSSRYRIAHGWKSLSLDLSSKLFKIHLFLLSFLYCFFLLLLFFYSSFFMLLWTFKKHSTCYNSPPPCLNDCSSSSIEVRGPMAAKEVQNPCIPPCRNSHNHWWVPLYVICLEILPENLQKNRWKIIHTQFGLWSRR
jgi:hypothetical protein